MSGPIKAGQSMTDAAGRAKLAQELRDLADKFDLARAIATDAAKVLESDVQRMTPPVVWPEVPQD